MAHGDPYAPYLAWAVSGGSDIDKQALDSASFNDALIHLRQSAAFCFLGREANMVIVNDISDVIGTSIFVGSGYGSIVFVKR